MLVLCHTASPFSLLFSPDTFSSRFYDSFSPSPLASFSVTLLWTQFRVSLILHSRRCSRTFSIFYPLPPLHFSSFSHIISLVPYFSLHPLSKLAIFFAPSFFLWLLSLSLSFSFSLFSRALREISSSFFHFPVPFPSPAFSSLFLHFSPSRTSPFRPPPFLYFKLSLFFPTFPPPTRTSFCTPFFIPVPICPHSQPYPPFLLLFSFPNYSLLLPYFSLHFLPPSPSRIPLVSSEPATVSTRSCSFPHRCKSLLSPVSLHLSSSFLHDSFGGHPPRVSFYPSP